MMTATEQTGPQPGEEPRVYTLCFIIGPPPGEPILMLHRRFPPHQGQWNGVGGRLEQGEEPRAGCLREVEEETGLSLSSCTFGGLVSWAAPGGPPAGYLYVFLGREPHGRLVASREGDLAWQPREWVFGSPDVVSNIPIFLPPMLAGAPVQEWRFYYVGEQIVAHDVRPLPHFARRAVSGERLLPGS